MDKKKLITFLLALTMILSLSVGVSAAETTEAKVPVTLTVVNTVSPISCTVPAALPVSLVDGYVVCANNAAITNTGKTGAIRVTKVDVQAGTFEIGNFDDFTASKNSIALSINGCSTKGAGSLTLLETPEFGNVDCTVIVTAFRDGKEIGTLNTELTLHVAYLWPKEVQ